MTEQVKFQALLRALARRDDGPRLANILQELPAVEARKVFGAITDDGSVAGAILLLKGHDHIGRTVDGVMDKLLQADQMITDFFQPLNEHIDRHGIF